MTTRTHREGLGAVPLRSLAVVALDTETTGLNPDTDRLIQIGAVAVRRGAPDPADGFERFVRPGIPVPAASTAIHGITDADLADAEDPKTALAGLGEWIAERVVVGHSIGFDLALLKAEHRRAGLEWRPYRSLCVRHLVEVLGPNIPDPSLDTVAAWLGIDIANRHRAPDDALAAAKVFAALLPRLAEKGVRTLAQAERACLALTPRIDEEFRAGWHAVVSSERLDKNDPSNFQRIDGDPFRRVVGDIMSGPPVMADPGDSLSHVLRAMMTRRISSVFLPPDGAGDGTGGGYGVLTERDVLRAVDEGGGAALDGPVGPLAARPLVCIGADEYVYRAIALMTAKKFRHLGVVDADGALVGALSARDLLKRRGGEAVQLAENIDAAETEADLGRVWADLTRAVAGLIAEELDPRDIAAVVSRELRALTCRACEIAEAEMERDGRGAPPVPYAMLVLGSGGRGESLLAMDQDNAIVFTEGEPGGPEDAWFEAFASRVADILDASGVDYCKGGVMAKNPQWRMSVDGWRDAVGTWIGRSKPEDVLNCDIFFDSVAVHGDPALGERVRADALDVARDAKPFLQALRANASDVRSPVGLFGRLKLEDGRVDVKRHGLMPIFSTARVLAIEGGVRDRSTRGRLTAIRGQRPDSADSVDNLIEAHRILLGAVLVQQIKDIAGGLAQSNKVEPAHMSDVERERFRWALDQVEDVRGILGMPLLG